jgi:hypothetical protein
MANKKQLCRCSRCHRVRPVGEVLEKGKHYPACTLKYKDGTTRKQPESWEIKRCLCVECMVEFNKKDYDRRHIDGINGAR